MTFDNIQQEKIDEEEDLKVMSLFEDQKRKEVNTLAKTVTFSGHEPRDEKRNKRRKVRFLPFRPESEIERSI